MQSYRFHFEKSVPSSVLSSFHGGVDETALKELVATHFAVWEKWDKWKAQNVISSYQDLYTIIHLQKSFYTAFKPRHEWPLYRGLSHAIEAGVHPI